MLVHRYLEETAARTPDTVAVKTDELTLTFAQLDAQANAIAHGLRVAGVSRGDRVAVYLDNRVEAVVSIFGILKAGAAFLMINPSAKEGKVSHLLHHGEVAAAILPSSRIPPLVQALASVPTLRAIVSVGATDAAVDGKAVVTFADLLQDARRDAPPTTGTIDLDLAGLLYTSGSTGEPKGVMLTHANVRTAIDATVEYLHITADDRLMNVLPLSFGYGLTVLFSSMKTGAPLFLEKGIVFPHVTLMKMATERITGFAMVPTICAVLLGLDLSKYDLSALRYVTNAGAGLPVPYAKRFLRALPHVQLVLMYGQTECLRVTYLEPDQVNARPDALGHGMPNQELWLVDPDGNPVAPGEIGELVVRGSHVMRGYWRMPTQTAQRLRPGRYPGEMVLYTGDLFRQDSDGYLHFVARGDDIIKSKGEKVSPREVENVLLAMDGVGEAVVLGVDHPVWGQAIKALLVLRPGVKVTAKDIQRHCAKHLEDFMVPTEVEFRSELPKTDNGKIAKAVLKGVAVGV
jgi:long-chain acyl-CoA synthetase